MIEAISPYNYRSDPSQHLTGIVPNMKNLQPIDMHYLVQELGHCIVNGEYPNNPEKHSRVWKREDIMKIFAMDATTAFDMIETTIPYYRSDPSQHLPRIVAKMKNLRWIDWTGDFASPLPPRGLRFLRLDGFLQKQLWDGCKLLPNLKIMELYRLDNLIMTPDFDGLPNLERLTLFKCERLVEIHPSIGRLESLISLSITNCANLKKFPPIAGLKKLEILAFCLCPKPFIPSENQQKKMDNLHLNLDYGGTEIAYEIQEENMENAPHHGLDNIEKEVASFKLSEIHRENIENSPHHGLDNSGKEVASHKRSFTNFFVTWLTSLFRNISGVECYLEEPSLPHNNVKPCLCDNNMNHTRLHFFFKDLKKMNLSFCSLGDEDIGSAVWEFPNLKKLDLAGNNFSQLSFNRLRLPRLKWLRISFCRDLLELSELPSSIVVVIANDCPSLESFRDISNCKWLWNVSLVGENKLPGDILADSMLQGNAIEDYFINIIHKHRIPKGYVWRMFRTRTLVLPLPDNWYNDFYGFLICIDNPKVQPNIKIVIREEEKRERRLRISRKSNKVVEEEHRLEEEKRELRLRLSRKSNKVVEEEHRLEPEYERTRTFLGYLSFSSLRHSKFSNSSNTVISVSVDPMSDLLLSNRIICYLGVDLVARKSKGHQPQTTEVATDSSEYWDEERQEGEHTFTIQDD